MYNSNIAMGVILHHEPEGAKFLVACPRVRRQLRKVGWLNFFEKFKGCDIEVTEAFERVFYGVEAEIGDIRLKITDSFLAEAIRLPRTNGNWFKYQKLIDESRKSLLKNPDMDIMTWRKRILISTLKRKW